MSQLPGSGSGSGSWLLWSLHAQLPVLCLDSRKERIAYHVSCIASLASTIMASLRLRWGVVVPRGGFQMHSRQLQLLRRSPSPSPLLSPPSRCASTERPAPPKPRVLEKPDKFRPPSHPSRIRQKTRYTYGPELTQSQKSRRYPHMMPPEGSFMHWFLTNRSIHLYISLVCAARPVFIFSLD